MMDGHARIAVSAGIVVAGVAISCLCSTARAQGGPIPKGMSPHVRPSPEGEVDWANGNVVALGVGKARGHSPRDRQMAERAATLVAARNALAMTMGLKVDSSGRLSGVRNGEVRIRGMVKGHKVYLVDWRPDDRPPSCRVKMRIPLWGIKGVCSVVYDRMCRESTRRRGGRVALSSQPTYEDLDWLIIDARGMDVEPCLFPYIVDDSGRTFYDVSTIRREAGEIVRPAQYVESRMTWEELEACADVPDDAVAFADRFPSSRFRVNRHDSPTFLHRMDRFACVPVGTEWNVIVDAGEPTSRPASQPTSQPAAGARRKRRVVKAIKTQVAGDTKIVLSKEDAEKLGQSPEGAGLLRSGRVIIVVDGVAAGIQGRLRESDDTGAVLAREQ